MMTLRRLALLVLLSASPWSHAELVVVTGARNGVEQLTRQEVIYLFMGRQRQLPGGLPAVPLDFAVDSPERTKFYRQLVNKEPAEIRAYWSRLVFSGGARPPATVDNREELLRLLTLVPGTISYMERSKVDSRLRIVHNLGTAESTETSGERLSSRNDPSN